MSLPEKPDFDHEKIKQAVKLMFEAIGDDPNRPSIADTPERVAKAFEEIFEGCKYTNEEIAEANKVLFDNPATGIVVEKIEGPGLNGMCEHHLLPMYDMTVYIGYIPKGKVIGLSKLSRIAELCAKRPSLQEKIGMDIAECKADRQRPDAPYSGYAHESGVYGQIPIAIPRALQSQRTASQHNAYGFPYRPSPPPS